MCGHQTHKYWGALYRLEFLLNCVHSKVSKLLCSVENNCPTQVDPMTKQKEGALPSNKISTNRISIQGVRKQREYVEKPETKLNGCSHQCHLVEFWFGGCDEMTDESFNKPVFLCKTDK